MCMSLPDTRLGGQALLNSILLTPPEVKVVHQFSDEGIAAEREKVDFVEVKQLVNAFYNISDLTENVCFFWHLPNSNTCNNFPC